MFRRKKKQASNPAQDKQAQSIIVRLVQLQIRCANQLQRQFDKLSRGLQRFITVITMLLAMTYCVYLIMNALK